MQMRYCIRWHATLAWHNIGTRLAGSEILLGLV